MKRQIWTVCLVLILALFVCSACQSEPITYTVTFVQQGFADVIRTVEAGTACTDIPTPQVVVGYTVAWEESSLSSVGADMTVRAVLTPIDYAITYHLNGGENGANPPSYTIESEIALADPTRAGYTFGGWFAEEDLSGEPITRISIGEIGEKAFYAKWIRNEEALIFAGNGATGGNMPAKQVYEKDTITLPANTFVRAGYTFCGWSLAADGEVVYPDGAPFTMETAGATTLYAVWQANENRLVLHANGGTGVMPSIVLHTDEQIALPATAFARAGYTFCGWALTADGAVAYADTAPFVMGAEEVVTLYAVWQANKNTLVLHANGGTGAMDTILLQTDAQTTLPKNAFAREGHTFVGWALTANGTAIYTDGADFVMGGEERITLYAVWEVETYTITYRLDDGINATENPVTFTVFDLPISLADATREDAIFCGWSQDAAGEQGITEITQPKNYEVFAAWGGLYYAYFVNAEMVYTITGYYGKLTTLDIPSEYKGEPVGRIAAEAFKGCTTLTSVTIPETVDYIGKDAFLGCPCIEVVDGVQYVDRWAVGGADGWLERVAFREGTVGVSQLAFENRMDVLQVTFPKGFRYLDHQAFNGCDRFVECYNLSGNERLIGYSYVYGTLDDSVHLSAEEESFLEKSGDFYFITKDETPVLVCYNGTAEELSLPETYQGKAYRMMNRAFWQNDTLRSVKLPSTLTAISASAFAGCSALQEVDLASVSIIGEYAFARCLALTQITLPATVTTIQNGAFDSCYHLVEVYNLSSAFILTCGNNGNGSVAYYAKAVHTDAAAESLLGKTSDGFVFITANGVNYFVTYLGTETVLEMPQSYKNGTYEIMAHAFLDQKQLTHITLSDGVVAIADEAFTGSNLFETENGIVYVGNWAVDIADRKLPDLVFRKGTVGIADNAFAGMSCMTEITFPDGMKWIGKAAFYGSYHLLRATFPASMKTVGRQAFQDCYKLMEIYKAEGSSITFGEWCFRNAPVWKTHQTLEEESILDIVDGYIFATKENEPYLIGYVGTSEDLVLPANYKGSLYVIFANAFYLQNGIRSITLPDDLLRVQIDAFANSSVQTVVLGKNMTVLSTGMFTGCSSLTNITLPAGLQELRESVFQGCTALQSIVIPISVESVGARAFYACDNLTIYYEGASVPTNWHSDWNRSGCPLECGYNNVTTNATYNYVISGEKAYITAYKGSETHIVIPDKLDGYPVVDIANVFTGNTTIVSVELPSTVSTLRAEAFKGCTALVSIKLPETMTAIGESAFYRCLALKSIEIPTGVTVIRNSTFRICQSLESVVIPNTVTEIENLAFDSCSKLETIVIPISVTVMGDRVFWSCSKLSIYCEIAKKPSSWSLDWNNSLRPVTWGYVVPKNS